MTIHSEHPFADPAPDRNPLRRLRGRLPAPVSVWATGTGTDRVGLTVSSMLVADGDPGEVLGLIDGESDLSDELRPGSSLVVNLLAQRHRSLADVFAGLAPSPGGAFRTGDWRSGAWGPVLDGVNWIGARVSGETGMVESAGWARLVRARIEHIELTDAEDAESSPLAYLRGRYRRLTD